MPFDVEKKPSFLQSPPAYCQLKSQHYGGIRIISSNLYQATHTYQTACGEITCVARQDRDNASDDFYCHQHVLNQRCSLNTFQLGRWRGNCRVNQDIYSLIMYVGLYIACHVIRIIDSYDGHLVIRFLLYRLFHEKKKAFLAHLSILNVITLHKAIMPQL